MKRALALVLALTMAACAAGPAGAPAIEFSGPPGSGEPNLARTADGAAVLTWLEPVAGQRSALRIAVRTDGRWSEPRTIAASDSFFVNWADFPSLVALADGSWVVHWLARVPGGVYAYHVRLAISRDRGTTWSRPITAHRDRTPQEHGFVSMVPWDDSTAALVWLDGREMKLSDASHEGEGDMTLRFATVTSGGGGRLGEEVLLDARTCECCQTALARTAGGLVAAYRDRSAEEIRDIAVVRRVGAVWTPPVHVARDNWHYPGCPVNGPALSASGDTVAIAWFTAPASRPHVFTAFSFDGGASWGAPLRVDDGRPPPVGRVDIELVGGGAALVTWLEAGAVRARRVLAGGRSTRSWQVTESSDARSSGFPRVLRIGDEVLLAWTGAQGIRVAAQSLALAPRQTYR